MSARIGKFLVIVALVATTGFHWAILQTVAWTTMLADNLQTQSISESVVHTFDGLHPCCLCKAIAAAKKSEKPGDFTGQNLKFEYPPAAANLILFAPGEFQILSLSDCFAQALPCQPLTPPPRAV